MDASYRLGLSIVIGTVVSAALVCTAGVVLRPPRRAGEDLGTRPFDLGAFALTERSGRQITDADLADKVWVASFIFSRCPLSCPRITTVMKGLQGRLAGEDVQLVSLSVDPVRDTPEVLSAYARKFSADPNRWWFLTGTKDEVERLIRSRFKLGLATARAPDVPPSPGMEEISHSDRLALVDRGNRVVGYYDSNDRGAVDALVATAKERAATAPVVPGWVRRLPGINATLNGTATILLVLGWSLIRKGNVRGHATCMLLGVLMSALFLGCYLVYHYEIKGGVPFRGVGPLRFAYFTILISHVVLAIVMVPPILWTLKLALTRRFDRHAHVAKITFPIWLYVSMTGVVIYLLLYQLPVSMAAPG